MVLLVLCSIERELLGKAQVVEEKWAGLTAASIGQMVNSKWLERFQGDANGLIKAMACHRRLRRRHHQVLLNKNINE